MHAIVTYTVVSSDAQADISSVLKRRRLPVEAFLPYNTLTHKNFRDDATGWKASLWIVESL